MIGVDLDYLKESFLVLGFFERWEALWLRSSSSVGVLLFLTIYFLLRRLVYDPPLNSDRRILLLLDDRTEADSI